MRLSTALTPRVIACAEELPQLRGAPARLRRRRSRSFSRDHGVTLGDRGPAARRRAARARVQRRADRGPGTGGARPSRARHRRVRRTARRRQDGPRYVSRRAARAQHACPRPSQAAPRSMGRAALDVPRYRREGDRPDRRRQAQAQRSPRRGDDPEPGPERTRSTTSSRLWPRHRRRVPPRSGGLVRARALGGEGALRRGAHRHTAAPRRPSPDHGDAARAGSLHRRRQEPRRAPAVRVTGSSSARRRSG